MIKFQNSTGDFSIYVCPTCKGALRLNDEALSCPICQVIYPITEGIPDFILEDLTRSSHPVLRGVKNIDLLAWIYETKLWYPLVLNLYGGLGAPSLKDLVRIIVKMVDIDKGIILDVACGPGTLGRRFASPSKVVYGIDISLGMLHQGVAYVKKSQIPNVNFARAKAEAIPFPNDLFDAALCGGALHLFSDTVSTLREIGRTLKEGAPLAVMTFIAGKKGVLRFPRIRKHVQQEHGVHIFEIPELEQHLTEAGFENFQPRVYGSILVFSVRKRRV